MITEKEENRYRVTVIVKHMARSPNAEGGEQAREVGRNQVMRSPLQPLLCRSLKTGVLSKVQMLWLPYGELVVRGYSGSKQIG